MFIVTIAHKEDMLVTIVLLNCYPRKFTWIPKICANMCGTKTWLPVGVSFSAGTSNNSNKT